MAQPFLAIERVRERYRRAQQPVDRSLLENVSAEMKVDYHVSAPDRSRIPVAGPVVVTANHPFGLLDGAILGTLLMRVRPRDPALHAGARTFAGGTFRAAGEGTSKSSDLDRFDSDYKHVLLWNQLNQELVGAYRLGVTTEIHPRRGVAGLYTSTLFRYDPRVLERLGPALELGRSFTPSTSANTLPCSCWGRESIVTWRPIPSWQCYSARSALAAAITACRAN